MVNDDDVDEVGEEVDVEEEEDPNTFLERSVHFPHPPSPSNGMGVVYDVFFADVDVPLPFTVEIIVVVAFLTRWAMESNMSTMGDNILPLLPILLLLLLYPDNDEANTNLGT